MIEIADYKHVILTITVCLPRMLTAFAVIPFLGSQVVNGLVRNSILLSFMLVLYPMLSPTIPTDLELSFSLVIVLFKEIVIGMSVPLPEKCATFPWTKIWTNHWDRSWMLLPNIKGFWRLACQGHWNWPKLPGTR